MPTPKKGESESDFVDRCVPIVMKEDDTKDTDHAVAKCHGIYRQSKKKNESEGKTEKLRAEVARGLRAESPVDRDNHIIYGYSVISKGEAIGHDLEIDDVTLEQVVEKGNATKFGIKSRFGHPNMSQSAFGTFVGRSKNFEIDGDRVRADLHIDPTAFESPKGNLGGYVEDLAESDPAAFGASIVFELEREMRLNEDGTRKKDDEGNPLLPLARVKTLYASDIVDDPATGDAMFEFFSDTVKPSAEITAFLDEYLKQEDAIEKAYLFLNKYLDNKEYRHYKEALVKKLEKVVSMEKEKELQFLPDEKEETQMTDKEKLEAEETQKKREKEIAELATEKERERIAIIRESCKSLKLPEEFAQKLIDDKVALDDARAQMIEESKKHWDKGPDLTVQVNNDEYVKKLDDMSNALLVRSGLEKNSKIISDVNKSQYRGLSIQNLAKMCLMKDGITDAYMFDGNELFARMMEDFQNRKFAQAPTQGSGDFVNVLSNVLNKSAGKGWATAPSTYEQWVGTGSLRDFKTADIPRLSEMGDVKDINEGEAPEMAKMSDTKEQTRLRTKGTKFILSRQAMVNDDLGMLTTVPARQMRALRRQMNKDCYGLIYNDNGSGTAFQGPTMNEDSAVLFNATAESTSGGHNNYSTSASGPTKALLNTIFIAFRAHRALTPDNNRSAVIPMNIAPAYLICGPTHEQAAWALFNYPGYNDTNDNSKYEGTIASNLYGQGQPRNMQLIVDQEIDLLDTSTPYYPWYCASNSMDVDTVILYTLNGQTAPYTDAAPTPTGDARGMIWVIEHDYRFAVGDWRGLYCVRGTS